jgi:hypothetical protein
VLDRATMKHSLVLLFLAACVAELDTGGEAASLAAADQVLADRVGRPVSLTVDATHLYWIDGDAGALVRMARTGGAITTLATGASAWTPWSIAVDATTVYWLDPDDGAVRATPRGGGVTRTLATGQGDLVGIAIDAGHVYFAGGDRVRRVAKWGGALATIATGSTPSALVADGYFVYVADALVLGGSNQIYRVPRAGGARVVLAEQEDAHGLVADAGHLYWKRFWTGDVRRGSRWMPGAATVAGDGGGWGDVAVDATHVWWTGGPVLHRAPKAGGAAETVYQARDWAVSIALDGDAAYLAVDPPYEDPRGGQIVRVAR